MLAVNHQLRNSLPFNFPSQLAETAFQSGDEWAWPPALAADAVGWLASHSYAVLGTELWLVRNGGVQCLPYWTNVSRRPNEPWTEFVARAGNETVEHLRSFKTSEVTEAGELYFNVVWADEEEFRTLIPG